MTAPKPAMKNVFDISNVNATMATVKQMAVEKGVPSMVTPQSEDAAAVPAAATGNVAPLRKAKKVNPAPTGRATIELPLYLLEELRLKMAKARVTKRYLILEAFKNAGYAVHDIDLYQDGRRGHD